ncbi:MAG: hypothetical protein J6T01_00520 [Kiritimatiellae bacterium]|nr:hypothetical protein [Kiritimatiellia bacterium]
MRRMLIFAAVLSLGASGCMWGRLQLNDPEIVVRARAIRPGATKTDELSTILGAQPTMRMPAGENILFGYPYSDTKSHGLMLLIVNFSKTVTVADTLYVETDGKSGVVKKVHIPEKREPGWEWNPFDGE